ncbi:PTI1-like tyrosine-protein kinase [Hibiscus syriacus]|uniref:PTI1-like tyrosine-protein kinase n=1 Tax=Hibiscus syriacus TaxID=106335 RepID=A0A6A2XR91_HIBSY|nr:PTI1-like tyrosine-protein kinase [Hibiscus syriacus]
MGGETKKQLSSSPKEKLEESLESRKKYLQEQSPFISVPFYVPSGATSSPFEQQFESVIPKRSRYNSGQWKLQPQGGIITSESSPSPTIHPQTQASSSDAASSPPHSPRGTSKCEGEQQSHQQFRKGKYVSPIWKPNEMLWLARAWRTQYQGGSETSGSSSRSDIAVQSTRGKTRADKDREVAEFLNKHGINRDAKTAGTKWDNMLGEFRKVYEWERGNEREQVGKSYFRLSPYERKLHRLPASFDEDVFEELSQFIGTRIRASQSRGTSSDDGRSLLSIPPPPPFKVDELPISVRTKPLVTTGNVGFGFPSSKELRRIGKIRMTWEESVSLWAEEGEHHRGRVKLQGSSFLNADELTFFDDFMVACTMEAFEDGHLKGFTEKTQLPFAEHPIRSAAVPPLEFQDPTDYYIGCLQVPPTTLPSLFELSWHLQEPPPEEYRFPLRKDVYKDLPSGKEVLFTTSNEQLDCRAIVYDVLSSVIRTNPSLSAATATGRDSFIALWDDCINRVVSKFCSVEMVIIRKPSSLNEPLQDQWPNLTGFVRNFCLWRGEETDQVREGNLHPSSSLVEKLLWTYTDLPYVLGYYAVGYMVTFCALSRSCDGLTRTDLCSVDLSSPSERLKSLVPCFRIASLLPLLADRCVSAIGSYKQFSFSDFERFDLGNGSVMEMTPYTVTRSFSNKKKWAAVKEIYDILDHRIPHAEFICRACEKDLVLVFKPRGCRFKPVNCEQLVEALKYVTKALVALNDLCFMHRDLGWDKVMRRTDVENEWFLCGFDEAVGAPQMYPHLVASGDARDRHAPEMGRGLHGVKVDVWGVGYLVKTCGLTDVPKMLRELESRCLDQNPEQRPTAADCYHHLLQVQSASSDAAPY